MKTGTKLFTLFTLYYYLVDFFRRMFFHNSVILLLGLDILFLIMFFYFFYKYKKFYVTKKLKLALLILAIWFIYLLLETLNPSLFDVITTLSGLRNYILPSLALIIAYSLFMEIRADKNKMLKIIFMFLLISSIINILYFFFDASFLINLFSPSEHTYHSYGEDVVKISSGFFASSKRFALFLLYLYIIFKALVHINLSLQRQDWHFVDVITFISIFFTGSRESIIIFILIWLIIDFSFKKILYGLMLVILFIYLSLINPDINMYIRFALSIDEPLDYILRFLQFFPVFALYEYPNWIYFGLGIGKYGQDSMLSSEVYDKTYKLIDQITLNHFGNLDITFVDSGLSKILIETGIIGSIIFTTLLSIIFFYCFYNLIFKKEKFLKYVSLIPLIHIIIFLKRHTLINDLWANVIFYISLGILLAYRNIKIYGE